MKVIYIEDDPTNRTVMQEMLGVGGISVADAADARTGLAMIAREPFDLVIMDLRMPEISGLTAIRQLRSREPAGRRVPILVLTAELTAGVRELCRTAGADEFMEKPVSMAGRFARIGSILSTQDALVLG